MSLTVDAGVSDGATLHSALVLSSSATWSALARRRLAPRCCSMPSTPPWT